MPKLTFLQAIQAAQFEEMTRDKNVFIMGEDVEANMFGTTTGMIEAFGAERVRDTPIAEAGMAGVAAGALTGWAASRLITSPYRDGVQLSIASGYADTPLGAQLRMTW